MEKQYDYSRHKYCITLTFDYNVITSDIVATDKIGTKEVNYDQVTHSTSLLYHTIDEIVLTRGDLVEEPKGLSEGIIHIPNIFYELKSNYCNGGPKSHTSAERYNNFLQEAIYILQKIQYHWKMQKRSSDVSFFYAIIIPTNWEYEIREEFFRPLFIKTGLIHEDDGQGRLIFFSKIEPIFRHMQEISYVLRDVHIRHGDQFVMCTLDYQDTFCMKLELVSAQYPAFTVAESKFVPQLLKQVQFTIPFESQELQSSLIAYLEWRCGTTIPSRLIDAILVEVSEISKRSLIGLDMSKFSQHEAFQRLQSLLNWVNLIERSKSTAVEPITAMDVCKNVSIFADKILNYQMDTLLEGMSSIKTRSMAIFFTDQTKIYYYSGTILKSIERWSRKYCYQKTYYTSVANGEAFKYNPFQSSGILDLITYQMQVFNMRRAPVILPKDTVIEHSESCLKPVIFINIDMSLTQTKAIVTYLDQNRQAKHKKSFECKNIKPLDSFITYSRLYQRPVLRIKKWLKLRLKKSFGDYIDLFSPSRKQTINRRISRDPASKLPTEASFKIPKSTLINYNKMKSSKNRPKEIRNIFAYSNPSMFKQLTENVRMNDFWTSSNISVSAGNDSYTVCHPGSSWREKNIWYGVSIDKDLLETVFGSMKNLEKAFFACGMLQQDSNLRRAKFCTRGEEILPAIQQRQADLEFRVKSYFVVAQVFPKHIQLTLHQVVILASSEEDAATIIIQDEIVYTDDVYNSLCKTLWTSMRSNCRVNYCPAHKDKRKLQHDLCSFRVYSNIRQNLQLCVERLLERNKASVDMDSFIRLNINSKCACSINVFLRDIIEVALMPVIEKMAAIIAGSLTNKELFGNYVANFIFVFGDPFNLSYGSMIHNTYSMLIQKAIDDAVQLKEKDSMALVLRESLCQLLESVTRTKPYLFENFITGTLCRVSSETYALRVKLRHKEHYFPFFRINRNGDIKNTIKEFGSFLVFIQKGKPISAKSFTFQLQRPTSTITFDILQEADSSKAAVPKKYSVLDSDAAGARYQIDTSHQRAVTKIMVECKQVKYDLFIKVSRGYMDLHYGTYYFPLYDSRNIIEPLTLAYL